MTVSELIKLLEKEDSDTTVMFAYPYGDHWDSIAAEEVNKVYEHTVRGNSYPCDNKVIVDNDGINGDDEDIFNAIVLSNYNL